MNELKVYIIDRFNNRFVAENLTLREAATIAKAYREDNDYNCALNFYTMINHLNVNHLVEMYAPEEV
jgi:hypothetical protein